MKTPQVLILAGLAAAAYYFAQLGTAGRTVQIVFSGVQPVGLLKYRLNFIVQNVSNAAMTMRSFTGEVSINDNEVGNVSTFDEVDILPNSETPVNVDLNISLISLPTTIKDLVMNSHGNFKFNVDGNMNLASFVLPVSLEQTLIL